MPPEFGPVTTTTAPGAARRVASDGPDARRQQQWVEEPEQLHPRPGRPFAELRQPHREPLRRGAVAQAQDGEVRLGVGQHLKEQRDRVLDAGEHLDEQPLGYLVARRAPAAEKERQAPEEAPQDAAR